MNTTIQDRPDMAVTERRVPYTALAVGLTVVAMLWPGGRSPLADHLLMITVLLVILRAVTRHPGFTELFDALPVAAKWGAKAVIAILIIGQFWGVSAQTFPVATWTMYSHNPTDQAIVYRFDGVTADGQPVTFTPSAGNRTVPAKTSVVVHLRGLASQLYLSTTDADTEQMAADEEKLRRAIVAFVELHNEQSPDAAPVLVEVSRVVYDTTQERVTLDSGERTLLLQMEFEPS